MLKEQALKHAPIAAAALAAAVAVRIMMPTVSAPSVTPVVDGARAETPTLTQPAGIETRLVSCGAGAKLVGTDKHGAATLGRGARGTCTILFADRLAGKDCAVTGGRIAKLTPSDLVVAGAAERITYDCKGRP